MKNIQQNRTLYAGIKKRLLILTSVVFAFTLLLVATTGFLGYSVWTEVKQWSQTQGAPLAEASSVGKLIAVPLSLALTATSVDNTATALACYESVTGNSAAQLVEYVEHASGNNKEVLKEALKKRNGPNKGALLCGELIWGGTAQS